MLNNPKQRSTDKITGQFNPPLTGLVFYPQTLPGKFSRFSLGLRTITKSLSFPLLFSRFRGGLCGWPRFESSSWGMFSLSTSSFSRAETPIPESISEVLLEPHPHVKIGSKFATLVRYLLEVFPVNGICRFRSFKCVH